MDIAIFSDASYGMISDRNSDKFVISIYGFIVLKVKNIKLINNYIAGDYTEHKENIYIKRNIYYQETGVININDPDNPQKLGRLNSNKSELVALFRAIKYCYLNEMKNVYFYSDSLTIINALNGIYESSDIDLDLINQCRNLLFNIKDFKLSWVKRLSNKTADRIVRERFILEKNIILSKESKEDFDYNYI